MNSIKDEATFRDRLPLRDLTVCMDKLVDEWSFERNPTFITAKIFNRKPLFSTHEWTFGFEWVRLNKRIVRINHQGTQVYMLNSTKSTFEATKDASKAFLNKNLLFCLFFF